MSSAFSGKIKLSLDPNTGSLSLSSPSDNIVNGDYELVVPKGLYDVGIEPVDGAPVPASSVSLTTQIGAIFGQQAFNKEFWNRNRELGLEYSPGESFPVPAFFNTTNGINFVTNISFNVNQFGNRVSVGFTSSTAGSWYVVRVPLKPIIDTFGSDFLVQSALFDTVVADASVVPKFSEAISSMPCC